MQNISYLNGCWMFKISIPGDNNPQTVFPSLIGGLKDFVTFGTSEYYMGDEEQWKRNLLMVQGCCFCFEGFCIYKCLIFNYFALLFFSIVISTILAMVLSAALLAQYCNIKKDICYPIQKLNTGRKGDSAPIIPEEKRLQIVSQNDTHISIIMPCSSEALAYLELKTPIF
jgi:hypothetical protein